MISSRFRRAPRGQNMVLFAMTMVLVVALAMMTVSIGVTASRKADLDNVSDALAYTQAVSAARTFNSAAVMNRAMVAHYVAMSGITAQVMYMSTATAYFEQAAQQFRYMDVRSDVPFSDPDVWDVATDMSNSLCRLRSTELRDASYEMWHAALSMYGPTGADNVAAYCDYRLNPAQCTGPARTRTTGIAQVEAAAMAQMRSVHDAIRGLANLEKDTFAELVNSVAPPGGLGDQARHIVDAAGLRATVRQVKIGATNPAEQELNDSVFPQRKNLTNGNFAYEDSASRPVADAVLGSRPGEILMLPNPVGVNEFLPPLVTNLNNTARLAFAAYSARYGRQPNGNPLFDVTFTRTPDIRTDYSYEDLDDPSVYPNVDWPEDPFPKDFSSTNPAEWTDLTPSMSFGYGRATDGVVRTQYYDRYNRACAGPAALRTIRSSDYQGNGFPQDPVLRRRIRPSRFVGFIKESRYLVDHKSFGFTDDFMHMPANRFVRGCHVGHTFAGNTNVNDVHRLEDALLPMGVLGFNLPSPDRPFTWARNITGARGVWGQPKLSVMLSAQYPSNPNTRSGPQPNPWNLVFRGSAYGSGLNMKASEGVAMVTSSAGLPYYHRRDHLGEPPNLLNPFWRATLVPMEIDERGVFADTSSVDITGRNARPHLDSLLSLGSDPASAPNRAAAAAAYVPLRLRVRGMVPQP